MKSPEQDVNLKFLEYKNTKRNSNRALGTARNEYLK